MEGDDCILHRELSGTIRGQIDQGRWSKFVETYRPISLGLRAVVRGYATVVEMGGEEAEMEGGRMVCMSIEFYRVNQTLFLLSNQVNPNF